MLWRGIGAFAAIAVLGALAGHVAAGSDDSRPSGSIRVGAVTLTLTGAWRPVDATTLSNGLQSMRVLLRPVSDPSLVPAGIRAKGKPKAVRLGGYRAWSYGTVDVLPTTRGVLAIECACTGAIKSVSVADAAILAPEPDVALRLRAPAVLATLDATRIQERSAWTATSAARLAAAHRTALDALRPLATPPLTGALADAEAAYARLAAAAPAGGQARGDAAAGGAAPGDEAAARAAPAGGQARGDAAARGAAPGDEAAARAAVGEADRALEAAVASLARAGAPAVQRSALATTPASGGGSSLGTLLLVLLVAVSCAAFGPAVVRRVRAARGHAAAGRPGTSEAEEAERRLAADRRTPIAPPPTYGRWNETPRGPGVAPQDGAAAATMARSSRA